MNNAQFMENLVEQYCPQLPIEQLVIEINNMFHSFDAEIYDTEHLEISEQLPPIWREMSIKVTERLESKALHILDFGCGTGFEAQQLLRNIPANSIAALTCYDPSPEMLERCREKVRPLFSDTRFCSSLEEALTPNAPYTLLISNSVLHHLPDVTSTIRKLLPSLATHAMWLAGHEPSLRFHKNRECVANLEAFLQERRRSPGIHARLLNYIRRKSDPYAKTARKAAHTGLFQQRPPTDIIGRLVDFHVAHSTEEVSAGRGFDFSTLEQDFQASWKLTWLKTYGFMGPFYEGRLPDRWARSCQELARRFPKDGANFCTIWQRV